MRGVGYSLFVRVMRVLLPASALALVALIALWPKLQGLEDSFVEVGIDSLNLEEDGRVRLDNPRYVGEATDGEPYAVEALSARVDPVTPRVIELEQMRAELPSTDSRDVALTANAAIYDRDEATIQLDDGIELTTADGYRFVTRTATVALEAGTVESATPVAGDGPAGAIWADRLEVEGGGDVIRFVGNVRVTLAPATTSEQGS